MRLTWQGVPTPAECLLINFKIIRIFKGKKKLATLFLCCLVSKALWLFNCCFQTPQVGSHHTDTTASICGEKPAEHTDNYCTKFAHEPHWISSQGFGEWGLKNILRAQKIHKWEKETPSTVATHLLTYHFTRNQYSPNCFCQKHKGTTVQSLTRDFFYPQTKV